MVLQLPQVPSNNDLTKKESLEEENARLQEQLERERLEAENMRPEHEIKMNWINQIGEGLCVSIRLRSTRT